MIILISLNSLMQLKKLFHKEQRKHHGLHCN
uniref:Uncharacterized protein n=1 Tax=Myoviridae sp. ctCo31 TaxID=2825053 RepID=A0A8S5UMN8_9CAUD|nr:MAG TPA: hypothetical protein [Myoviridae sp. ctCo31]